MLGNVVIEHVDTEGVTKPVTTFVERLSDFIGGFAEPYQIVRVAKAEAKADRIRAESEIEIAELRNRAFNRLVEEQIRKQRNLEAIRDKAIPLVRDSATPEKMAHDWIANVVEKSQNVSDEQMQEIWARILAGEANDPGTFSRRTINVLANMDKNDAELFALLCRFVWIFPNDIEPIVYTRGGSWQRHGITFDLLTELVSLGVIQTRILAIGELVVDELSNDSIACYGGKRAQLRFPNSQKGSIPVGNAVFTSVGRQLYSIVDPDPIDGFFEFMCDKWKDDPNIESVMVLGEEAE